MNALNAVALALYLVQLLAFAVYAAKQKPYGADLSPTVGLPLVFGGHALVSGLFVACVLGAAGTLPYQQQRTSVTKAERGSEIAFGAVGAVFFAGLQVISWTIAGG